MNDFIIHVEGLSLCSPQQFDIYTILPQYMHVYIAIFQTFLRCVCSIL
jgi:hypothetical protein